MEARSPTVRYVRGPTILLHSGVYFDFAAPEACQFTIEDIAHGLSNICRFGGQSRAFYSVAQHSVFVSSLVPPGDALAGLLHDAAEAFVGDMVKPLKDIIPGYREIEKRDEKAIFDRLGVTLPLAASIKEADIVMLATEQRALMSNRDDWDYTYGRQPLDIQIEPLLPAAAKALFLERYVALTSPHPGKARPWIA